MGRLILEMQDTQTAPAPGDVAIYVKTDGKVYLKNASGIETPLVPPTGMFAAMQVRRAATWSSSNFRSMNAIRFDTLDMATDTSVIGWSDTDPSRITIGQDGFYVISGNMLFDSTGGSTYTLDTYLRKNGSEIISGSQLKSGNGRNEDLSVTLQAMVVQLSAGDYIEWRIDNNNLNGNLAMATLNCTRHVQ